MVLLLLLLLCCAAQSSTTGDDPLDAFMNTMETSVKVLLLLPPPCLLVLPAPTACGECCCVALCVLQLEKKRMVEAQIRDCEKIVSVGGRQQQRGEESRDIDCGVLYVYV